MPNPWDNDPIVGQAPASSPFGPRPVIQEAPPPPKTSYRTLSPEETKGRGLNPEHAYQVSSDGDVKDLGETQPKVSPKQTISQDMSADHVVRQIGVARKQIDAGHDTGNFFGSKTFQGVPYFGQNAANLNATISGLQGSVINDTIQQLKQLSATGASGYGSLSETEAERLSAAVAALQQTQDTPSLKANLDELERHYKSARAIIAGEDPRDPSVAAKYGITAGPGASDTTNGSGGNDGTTPPPNDRARKLSPEQQQEFFGILETRGPDAADAYLGQFGLALKSKEDAAKPHSSGIQYPSDLGRAFAVGAGGVAQGAGDLAGVVSNPVIRGVNAVFGTDYRPDMGANLRDTLGLPAPQNNREQLINALNAGGTAALGVGGIARAAAPYVAPLANALGGALGRLGSAPLTDSAAGAAGNSSSEIARQNGAGPGMQMLAGVAGGAATLPVSGSVNALMGGRSAIPGVVRAGEAEGVTVNRAMADPSLTQKVTAVGKTMTGGRMMQRDMGRVNDQIQGRVQSLGQGGEKLEPLNAGQSIQNIGKRYISTSGKDFDRQYGNLRKAADGVPIQAKKAVTQIDGILERLNQAPTTNAKEIAYLQGVKSDLSNGLSVEAARDIGTKLSKDIAKGELTFGKAEKDVLGIRKAVSGDIEAGLRAAGRGGVAARFRKVDGAYSERMGFIHGTLKTLLGSRNSPLAPEKAAGRLGALASPKGDVAGLTRVLSHATPEERADIAATYADKLGRDRDGQFSVARLTGDINNIPEAARTAIFGKEGARSLENVASLAREAKRVNRALGGSPTGVANDYRSFILNTVLGFGSGAATGSSLKGAAVTAGLMAGKVGRDALNARMLMSPKITGWLRSAPRTTNPAAINAHFDRLKVIAVREPALSPDIQRLEESILRAANGNATPSLAASQSDQGDQNNQ